MQAATPEIREQGLSQRFGALRQVAEAEARQAATVAAEGFKALLIKAEIGPTGRCVWLGRK